MLRVMPTAFRRHVLPAVLLAGVAAACGPREVTPADEPWPLTLEQPGMVGYTAVRLPAAELGALLVDLVGSPLEGLDAGRPLVALHVDPQAFGGSYALLLPVTDGDAFLDALAHLPGMSVTARGQHQLDVAPDSALGQLMLLTSSVRGASSLMDLMQAFENLGPPRLSFHAREQDGWVLLAPTFEAGSACTAVLQATRGFAEDPPHDLVLSLDLERVRLVHAAEIQHIEDQLKGLIGGARTAGLFGMAARMGHDGGGGSPMGLDVNWEVLWALKDMAGIGSLQALQVQLELPEGEGRSWRDDLPEFLARLGAAGVATLRVRATPGSPLRALADALRPAPDLAGAPLVLAADGAAFARAFAEWTRPLAEVVKGQGTPCDRYVDELASNLAGFGGTLALQGEGDDWWLLADAGDTPPDALSRLGAWLAPLLASARIGDLGSTVVTRETPDGRTLLVDADGEVRASVGRAGGVLWLRLGDQPAPAAAVQAFERSLAGPAPAGAPCVRVRSELGDIDLRTDGAELHLELRRSDDG